MPARLKLYVDWFNKTLITSNRSSTPFTLPPFYQGDVVPMQVQIVEPDPNGGPSDYLIVDPSSIALRLGISDTPTGDAGGPAPFVTQYSWTTDSTGQFLYANVAFNTAALATYLGSSRTKSPWFELEITEGSAVTTIYQSQVTLNAEVNESSSAEVAPGETALSLEVAEQMFAKKYMNAGESITLVSQDGTKAMVIYVHNDGSFRTEQYAI